MVHLNAFLACYVMGSLIQILNLQFCIPRSLQYHIHLVAASARRSGLDP
jgi:hypothetical protein